MTKIGKRKNFLGSRCKRGNLFLDLMMVMLVLTGMAIIGFVAYNVLSDLNTDIQNDPDLGTRTKNVSSTLSANFPTFMDGAFLLTFILLWIFLIVSSVLIDTHPMFMVVTIILLLFAFGIVMMVGNSFE